MYFLSNRFVEKRNNYLLNKTKEYEITGITYEEIGKKVYHDYNYGKTDRYETVEKWIDILNRTHKSNDSIGIHSGNQYSLKYTDFLLNIPIEDSGYYISDYCIPFYQMVVHGLIPYSSEPGNYAFDFDKQMLKWIEYGCIPYFRVTEKEPELLKYTTANDLYSSEFDFWFKNIIDAYNKISRIGNVWKQKIKRHDRIDKDFICITYENDDRIYINYSETENKKIDGIVVTPKNFIWVKEGNDN